MALYLVANKTGFDFASVHRLKMHSLFAFSLMPALVQRHILEIEHLRRILLLSSSFFGIGIDQLGEADFGTDSAGL
jgi:hypothetical protein